MEFDRERGPRVITVDQAGDGGLLDRFMNTNLRYEGSPLTLNDLEDTYAAKIPAEKVESGVLDPEVEKAREKLSLIKGVAMVINYMEKSGVQSQSPEASKLVGDSSLNALAARLQSDIAPQKPS